MRVTANVYAKYDRTPRTYLSHITSVEPESAIALGWMS